MYNFYSYLILLSTAKNKLNIAYLKYAKESEIVKIV